MEPLLSCHPKFQVLYTRFAATDPFFQGFYPLAAKLVHKGGQLCHFRAAENAEGHLCLRPRCANARAERPRSVFADSDVHRRRLYCCIGLEYKKDHGRHGPFCCQRNRQSTRRTLARDESDQLRLSSRAQDTTGGGGGFHFSLPACPGSCPYSNKTKTWPGFTASPGATSMDLIVPAA